MAGLVPKKVQFPQVSTIYINFENCQILSFLLPKNMDLKAIFAKIFWGLRPNPTGLCPWTPVWTSLPYPHLQGATPQAQAGGLAPDPLQDISQQNFMGGFIAYKYM